ncbi:phage tail protein, partial [Salmonella enterica subsp. enterica serovar Typhimurium]
MGYKLNYSVLIKIIV